MGLLASWAGFFANIAQVILLVLGMFLILVVLLQRGRGGGLAGAFGGAGGQSAFGTKAGDVFTKITIGIAILWVITNGVNGMLIRASQSAISTSQLPSGDDEDGPEISQGDGDSEIPLAPEIDGGEGEESTSTTLPDAEGESSANPDGSATTNDAEGVDGGETNGSTTADPADSATEATESSNGATTGDASVEEATGPSDESPESNDDAAAENVGEGDADESATEGEDAANPPN